jgi:hypothetical protein
MWTSDSFQVHQDLLSKFVELSPTVLRGIAPALGAVFSRVVGQIFSGKNSVDSVPLFLLSAPKLLERVLRDSACSLFEWLPGFMQLAFEAGIGPFPLSRAQQNVRSAATLHFIMKGLTLRHEAAVANHVAQLIKHRASVAAEKIANNKDNTDEFLVLFGLLTEFRETVAQPLRMATNENSRATSDDVKMADKQTQPSVDQDGFEWAVIKKKVGSLICGFSNDLRIPL